MWQSYMQQLWSNMKYGLVACLTYFYLIRKLGVAQIILMALRYLPHHFYGMALNILLVETMVAQINCLLQHYGTDTALGNALTAATKHLQTEIGMAGCPLLYDYNRYGMLVTNTWTKTLREKISAYGIEVSLNYPKPKMPRAS